MKETIDIYNFLYQNIDTEYVQKLFLQFKESIKTNDNINITSIKHQHDLMDRFVKWIRYNRDIGKEYTKKIIENIMLSKYISEIGKGLLDSNIIALQEKEEELTPTIISPYAYTIKTNDINTVNGNLMYDCGEGIVLKNDGITPLQNIKTNTLITTLSIDDNTLQAMIKCADDGYGLLIGYYADRTFKNFRENLDRFYHIKNYLDANTDLKTDVYESQEGCHQYNALHVKTRRR